jgi:hypothetical protein
MPGRGMGRAFFAGVPHLRKSLSADDARPFNLFHAGTQCSSACAEPRGGGRRRGARNFPTVAAFVGVTEGRGLATVAAMTTGGADRSS